MLYEAKIFQVFLVSLVHCHKHLPSYFGPIEKTIIFPLLFLVLHILAKSFQSASPCFDHYGTQFSVAWALFYLWYLALQTLAPQPLGAYESQPLHISKLQALSRCSNWLLRNRTASPLDLSPVPLLMLAGTAPTISGAPMLLPLLTCLLLRIYLVRFLL